MLELSKDERKLVEFAHEEFGEFITQFLLAGLGEETAGRRWQFAVTYASGDGIPLERYVEVILNESADGPALFPRRRDPLVLLALLQLLISGGGPSQSDLTYSQGDVLRLLGWEDALEARREIDEAVERYSLMTFRWTMDKEELGRNDLSQYTAREGLISEYEIVDEERQDRQMTRVLNRVILSPQFLAHLRGRSLFGIEWNEVRSVTLTPLP